MNAEDDDEINMQDDFMEYLDFNQRYSYRGSLTTPPFSELLFWTVMPQVVPIKQSTKELFLYTKHIKGSDKSDPILGASNRETQPLNDRHVYKIDISEKTNELREYLNEYGQNTNLRYAVLDEIL